MVDINDIIKACGKCDTMAQQLLYERFANKLYVICRRYLPNEHDAKDALHDCFLKIFSHISQFKGSGSFEGWMARIAVNTAIKYVKKIKGKGYFVEVEKAEMFHGVNEIESEFLENENFARNSYQAIEQANFTKEELFEIIMEIPEHYRIVFNLFHIENCTHNEIAQLLDIDTNNSRIRLLRARNLIREALVEKIKKRKNLIA